MEPITETKRQRGRPRIHASQAERARAYRIKKDHLLVELQDLLHALADAVGRGRSDKLTNHLPDDPRKWVPELTERLRNVKLITTRKDAR